MTGEDFFHDLEKALDYVETKDFSPDALVMSVDDYARAGAYFARNLAYGQLENPGLEQINGIRLHTAPWIDDGKILLVSHDERGGLRGVEVVNFCR